MHNALWRIHYKHQWNKIFIILFHQFFLRRNMMNVLLGENHKLWYSKVEHHTVRRHSSKPHGCSQILVYSRNSLLGNQGLIEHSWANFCGEIIRTCGSFGSRQNVQRYIYIKKNCWLGLIVMSKGQILDTG